MTEEQSLRANLNTLKNTVDKMWTMIEVTKLYANRYFDQLQIIARERGYKPGWVFYRMKERYGAPIAVDICKAYFDLENLEPVEDEVLEQQQEQVGG